MVIAVEGVADVVFGVNRRVGSLTLLMQSIFTGQYSEVEHRDTKIYVNNNRICS